MNVHPAHVAQLARMPISRMEEDSYETGKLLDVEILPSGMDNLIFRLNFLLQNLYEFQYL